MIVTPQACKAFFRKLFCCAYLLPLLLLPTFDGLAETGHEAKGPEAQPFNFSTPVEIHRIDLPPDLYAPDAVWRKHPEFSTLPYNAPCEDCYELIERRTESTRYFVKKGSEGKTFFEQTAYGPLHVKNSDGFWVSIDSRLIYEPGAMLSARNQIHPFSLSLQSGTCTIENLQHHFRWNKDLELIRSNSGQQVSLGKADLSNPQYGENGVVFKEAWPGVDIVIYSLLSAVHTDFKFKTDPGAGSYTIIDHLDCSDELSILAPEGKFSDAINIIGKDNKQYYSYERAFVFDSVHNRSNVLFLDYQWEKENGALSIHFNRDEAVQAGLTFPMTVDPLVTSSNTLPQASINGSGYNALCFTGGCAYNLSVPSPANAVITDILFTFNYVAQGICWMNDGATSFSFNGCNSPNIPGFFWFCNASFGGTCTANNQTIFSDVQACVPPPSCGSSPMNFTLRLYRCFMAGGGCSSTCIGAGSPWTMTVRGQTVAVASAFASNANICAGASTNLTANGTFGVPPYSVTWNPGSLAGSPVSVSPTVSTIYTAVVTDACGITSTQTVNVNVTPVTNPGFTISPNPVCVGDPVTVTGLGAGPATSYDWLLPSSSSPAINNQQVLNGISYANPGTYSITLNYAQGTCVFPQTFNITVNPLPPLPIISSNGPVCEGDPINLDGPAIAGATYAWTGPNGFVSALEDPVISNATLSHSGTYQLTITVNGCSSPTATLNVVVNPLPALPVLGSNSPVCEGQTINLSSNNVPGGTYSWTGPNGFVSALEDPVINNATIGMSGTYNLSIALGTCVSPTANINIVVNPLPVINVSNTGPYCTASTIQLNAAGGTNYAWTGPGGFNSNLQNPVITNCSIANSGIYTVVVSDAAGCTASATTNVVVNSTLVVVPGSNSPLCAGDVLNLTCPAIAGGTYAWSGPNGFNSNLQNPTVNNAGNVNSGSYTINVTDANGCTGTANVNVVVNALPAANANNNSPVCAGDNVQLNASGGTVYSWSGPAGYINNNQNPIMAAVTIGMSGSYTVVVTDANNCSASASTNVVINPIPAGIASNNGPYCEGSNISLSVNTGSSYSWTGPAGFNSALQNPVINNSMAGMSGVYSVTVSDANNCSASFNTNVIVNALPNASALNNGPFCEGNNIALSASGGNTYAWSGPNSYNSVLQNPVIPNCSVSDAGAYTVVVIDANNCSSSAVTNVIVNTLPIANAGNNGPYCINNTINLNASGGVSYSWVGPGGFNSVLQNPVLPNAALLNSGNYTVTVTDANGCTSTASTQVQVNATLNVVASYSGAACEGQSFTLDVTQVPAASYAWTGPNTYNSVLQSPTINNAQMNMAGVYTVTVSTPSGCTGTSTINVSVLAAPAPNAGNNGPLCAGANLLLNASGGNSYSWTGPNGFNSNLQNPAINNAGTNAAGTYQVLVTAASGCTAITGTQVVINPTPLINITGNTTICEGSTISLIATGGITCTWSTPSGSTQNGFNLNIGSATMSDAGNYSATVSDAIGCSSSQTVNITIQDGPDASFGSSVTTGCAPECIDFIALNPGNIVSYEWRSEGQVVATSSSPSICFPAEGLYDISLSAQAANGCINTMLLADYINMEARPLADFITDRSEAADSDPVINFSNTSVGGSIFSWDFDDGSTENGTEVSHTFPGEGEYCVVLSATTPSGCSDEKEVCIKINPDFFIFIPNAFSPNGDGVNDKFEIKGTGVQEFELQIFDRWGGRLLSLNDFTTDWDGNVGGNSLAQGIYIYHLRVKSPSGKLKEYTGDITLIR